MKIKTITYLAEFMEACLDYAVETEQFNCKLNWNKEDIILKINNDLVITISEIGYLLQKNNEEKILFKEFKEKWFLKLPLWKD